MLKDKIKGFTMRYAFLILLVTSTAFAQIPEGKDPKMPVPVDVELTHSREIVQEVYGDQIRDAKTLDEKSKLAGEVLGTAKETNKLRDKYALLEQAKDLAVDAKNLTLTLQVIDVMATDFKVDSDQLKADAKADLAGGSKTTAKTLQQLEELDKVAKANPEKIGDVADACYRLSKTLRGPMQQAAIDRSIKYYEAAMPKLTGLDKKKAEGRVEELKNSGKPTQKVSSRRSNMNADVQYLIGDWDIKIVSSKRRATWTFNKNGTLKHSNGAVGKWEATKDGVIIKWSTGAVDWLRRPIDPRGAILDTKKRTLDYVLRKKLEE